MAGVHREGLVRADRHAARHRLRDGEVNTRLARTVAHATGVDLSARMLEYARKRSVEEGLTNVEFVQADAQVHPFPTATYDIAISNYGTMFFESPVAAFTNIRGALRPGGRLALLTWQPPDRQAWLQMFFATLGAGRDLSPPGPGVPGPFGLSEPDGVHAILEGAGFSDVDLTSIDVRDVVGRDGRRRVGLRVEHGHRPWPFERTRRRHQARRASNGCARTSPRTRRPTECSSTRASG